MKQLENSITVDVPIHRSYEHWTRFEDFPRFMVDVRRVERVDALRLRWVAVVDGQEREWLTEITHQVPDWQIGWRCMSRTGTGGSVQFAKLTPTSTLITLRLEYEPAAMAPGSDGDLGALSRRLRRDLANFKLVAERTAQQEAARRSLSA